MKALLARLVARLDAATTRERAMVFFAAAAVMTFAVYLSALKPMHLRQQQLVRQVQANQAEAQKLQATLLEGMRTAAQDPNVALRNREKQLRGAIAELNAKVAQEQRRFTPPESMRGVLEELLERNRRLTLVDLRTLPATPLAVQGAANAPALYRHGIEIAVSGGYGDLYQYLKNLEGLKTQLYWGRADLEVTAHPAMTLRVTVYTVSFDRAWLIV